MKTDIKQAIKELKAIKLLPDSTPHKKLLIESKRKQLEYFTFLLTFKLRE